MIHTHFHNCDFSIRADRHNRKRKAQTVIEIALGFYNLILLFKDGGHNLFCSSFSHAARYSDNGDIQLFAVRTCNILKSSYRVIYDYAGVSLIGAVRHHA